MALSASGLANAIDAALNSRLPIPAMQRGELDGPDGARDSHCRGRRHPHYHERGRHGGVPVDGRSAGEWPRDVGNFCISRGFSSIQDSSEHVGISRRLRLMMAFRSFHDSIPASVRKTIGGVSSPNIRQREDRRP